MKPHSRATRAAFRRAVWASVALHVVVVAGAFFALRGGERKPRAAGIDTRAPHVRMHLVEDSVSVEVPAQPAPPPPDTGIAQAIPKISPPPPTPRAVSPPAAAPALPGRPFAPAVPRTLPPELVALLRKPGANPSPAPPREPDVRPAGATGVKAGATPAMHGALKPGQTVVYVLDCSGSMGAASKFDAARAALAATLRAQPATVRVQVVVYDDGAHTLLASDGTAPPATDANVRALVAKLAALDARGKSNHAVAVRAALAFRPDVIVLLTDADDLTAAALAPVLATAAKSVAVCVGLVTADGVRPSRELKR